jgi:hypothetical protein
MTKLFYFHACSILAESWLDRAKAPRKEAPYAEALLEEAELRILELDEVELEILRLEAPQLEAPQLGSLLLGEAQLVALQLWKEQLVAPQLREAQLREALLRQLREALLGRFRSFAYPTEYWKRTEYELDYLTYKLLRCLEQILAELCRRAKLRRREELIHRFLRFLALLWQKLLESLLFSHNVSEFPNKHRPPCTTMPWNIRPALVVLWGVCWMFNPQNPTDDAQLLPLSADEQTLISSGKAFPIQTSILCS